MICKHCQTEIPDKSKRCPSCGKKTKRLFDSINASLVSSLIILVVTIFVVIVSTIISRDTFSQEGLAAVILLIVGIFLIPILGSILLVVFAGLDILLIIRVVENFKSWKTFPSKIKAKLIITLNAASLSLISGVGFIIWFIIKCITH